MLTKITIILPKETLLDGELTKYIYFDCMLDFIPRKKDRIMLNELIEAGIVSIPGDSCEVYILESAAIVKVVTHGMYGWDDIQAYTDYRITCVVDEGYLNALEKIKELEITYPELTGRK